MKLKLQKKILAFALIVCLGVTAVKWPLVTSANTGTETVDFTLSDDFSENTHTQNMWTNNLTTYIDAEKKNVQLTGVTDPFLISDAMWDEGNKPTKLSFTAYTSDYTENYGDDGLRVLLLDSQDVKLEFRINTAQQGGYHGVYNANDMQGLKTSDASTSWRLWQGGIGGITGTPHRYTFTYDWSKWDTAHQVTIKVDAFNGDREQLMPTQTKTFIYSGEGGKPETFNVGFKNEHNGAVIDNVKLKYQSSNEEFKTVLAGKYNAFTVNNSYATAKEYLKTYELLSATSKRDEKVAESYAEVSKYLKGHSDAYTDDFSVPDKTATLWTNDFEEKITEGTDGQVKLEVAADTFLISDAMWDEGNKPTKFCVSTHSSIPTNSYEDDGLRVQLLHSENVQLAFSINTAQASGYHCVKPENIKGLTPVGQWRVWQNENSMGKNTTEMHTYTFTYDWSKWDTADQVTIKVDAVNSAGTSMSQVTNTFTYSGDAKPETFKVGFQNQVNSAVIDDVSLSFKASEATLKSQLAEIYGKFNPDKTYKTAREYLKQYELLSATSRREPEVVESYAAVRDWLQAQQSLGITDDFGDADKTAILWTNNLDNKRVEESGNGKVELSDTTDTFLISDAMWDTGNKPTKLSFTAYTSDYTARYENDGLRVQLLNSEDVQLAFSINTAQQYGYHGVRPENIKGLTPGVEWRDLKAGNMGSNTATANTYTFTYDWSKWDTAAQVTITVDAKTAKGTFHGPVSQTFTCTDAVNKPETFKVGFQNYKNGAVIDNVKLKYQSGNDRFKTVLAKKYDAFTDNNSYATAKEYLKSYELLAATSKEDPNVKENYAEVSKYLKGHSDAYTDDFDVSDKTATLWTNDFEEKITGEKVELDTAADTFLVSDAMWDEGNKPTKFSFTAHTSAKDYVRGDDGLRVQLLHSENVNLEFRINTAQQGGYHTYFATGLTANRDNLRLWQPASALGLNTDTPIAYTFTYDWSQWDTGEVTVIADAIGKNNFKMTTETITFTYSGDAKPDTFKVGFQNQVNSAVIDNVQICYENSTTVANALVAKGATISTSFDKGAMIRMGFDYSAMRQYMIGTGETLVNYGAVLRSSDVSAYDIKQALEAAHKNEENSKFTKTTYSAGKKYMITVGNPNAIIVPNEYNVDIKGSADIATGRIDRVIYAVGYVITKAADGKYHYYFTNNTEAGGKDIEAGLIQKSVMDLLYALNNELLSRYEDPEVDDSNKAAFKEIVERFIPGDTSGNISDYTMANYKKAVKQDPGLTLEKKAQKEWLKYVYIQVNSGNSAK